MLAAGWHAHTLNAPGKFLDRAAEHDTPKRPAPTSITDQAVAETAAPTTPTGARHSMRSPGKQSRTNRTRRHRGTDEPSDSTAVTGRRQTEDADDAPEVILWAALSCAPAEGTTVPDLMTATGMSRPWVYLRLRELADRGQVVQVSRGRWRAVTAMTTRDCLRLNVYARVCT